MTDQNHYIHVSTGTVFRSAIVVISVLLLYRVLDVIGSVLVAVVIAAAIEPAIVWMRKYKIPRMLAVIILYVLIFIIFILAVYSIAPSFVQEFRGFANRLPEFVTQITTQLSSRFDFLPFDTIGERFRAFVESKDFSIEQATEGLIAGSSAIFGGVLSLLIIIVISFYLAVQEKGIANFLRIISPDDYESYVVDVWTRSQRKIERWLQGQLLLAVLVGAIVYIGLSLMGVQYALALGVLSAMFELIPFFGPIMAAIPGIIIASLQSPTLGFMVLIFYVLVQQFENHLIYPVVVRKMIGISPIVVIIALIIGGKLAGLYGIVLAIPMVVVLIELLNDRAARKQHHVAQ